MADITAEIPTLEEVIANAVRTSDASTIVNEALERRSSNSSAAAFSPFIVADVKEINDIPEVTMTQSVYASLRAADIPAPPVTPLPNEEIPTIDTSAPLPESTESSVDEPVIPISHRPLEIGEEPAESDSDGAERDDAESEQSDEDDAESEHLGEEEEADDDENSVHSQEEDHQPKEQPVLEAQIPTEIMFLLFVVLILNSFNFLLSLTGARQCIRPF
jgi:hypothetical protein